VAKEVLDFPYYLIFRLTLYILFVLIAVPLACYYTAQGLLTCLHIQAACVVTHQDTTFILLLLICAPCFLFFCFENYVFFQLLSFFFLLLLLCLFFFHVLLHRLLFLHPLSSSTHHSFPSPFALPPSPSQSTYIHYPSFSTAFFLSLFPLILSVFPHLPLLVYLPSLLLSFFSFFCHISFCFPFFLHIYILLFYFTYFCSVSSDYSYLFTRR